MAIDLVLPAWLCRLTISIGSAKQAPYDLQSAKEPVKIHVCVTVSSVNFVHVFLNILILNIYFNEWQ